jgi:hypothetical protein
MSREGAPLFREEATEYRRAAEEGVSVLRVTPPWTWVVVISVLAFLVVTWLVGRWKTIETSLSVPGIVRLPAAARQSPSGSPRQVGSPPDLEDSVERGEMRSEPLATSQIMVVLPSRSASWVTVGRKALVTFKQGPRAGASFAAVVDRVGFAGPTAEEGSWIVSRLSQTVCPCHLVIVSTTDAVGFPSAGSDSLQEVEVGLTDDRSLWELLFRSNSIEAN